ncbi:MAG: phosphotransferase [Terracidiphilus sp.]|jgi:hypothetical protein
MATELSSPFEALSVSDILNALEIDPGIVAEEPKHYFAIPGNSGPRWLIPAHSSASASVLSAWKPYSISGQLKWFAIRMAARAGVLRLVASVSRVAASREGALRWFERCGIASRTGEIVVLVGNPSPDRKLIVFLLDDAHRIAAVLKVGLTASGGLAVIHEAEVLSRLERYSWAPKLLSVHFDQRAAAQEYVHGAMPNLEFRQEYLDLLCRLPRTGNSKSLTDVADDMASRLNPFKAELNKVTPDLLDRALACLDLDVTVPTLLVHGDFAPWNIRKNPEVGYVLVDWEWADFAGLPAYDLLHFHFNNDWLFGGKAVGSAVTRARPICAEYLRRLNLDPEILPRLAIAYLLDQLDSRCHELGSAFTAYTLSQLAIIVDTLGVVLQPGAQIPEQ